MFHLLSTCLSTIMKKDLIMARKLCYVFHFIDDLNAINDAGIFNSNFRDIYPEDFLRKENRKNAEAIFFI